MPRRRAAACLAIRRSTASRRQRRAAAGREQRLVGRPPRSASHARRTATVSLVSGVMRCLRPLPVAADVRAGAEVDVAAGQGRSARRPAARSGRRAGSDRVVAAAEPGAAVRGGEQRVDLGLGEVADERAVVALGRDRQHPLDRARVLGVAQRGVAVEASGSRRAGRCGSAALLPRSVRGGPGTRRSAARRGRRGRARWADLPVALRGEAEQQPERVAVGGDRVRAGVALADQPSVKNACSVGASAVIARLRDGARRRPPASSSSSGAACRYQ